MIFLNRHFAAGLAHKRRAETSIHTQSAYQANSGHGDSQIGRQLAESWEGLSHQIVVDDEPFASRETHLRTDRSRLL
jgi:hypothetical protein